jgi:tellurite resistance protein TerC
MIHISYWIFFNLFVITMLVLDLGVFHAKSRIVSFKESLAWTGFWMLLAFIFNFIIYKWQGQERALEFLTGYLIEKSLSIDNIFVILLIFEYFQVPLQYQHRVLFWGILGALIMRAAFIFAGVELIQNFHWVIYIFGALLIITGVRMIFQEQTEIYPEKNPIINLVKRLMPVSASYDKDKFFTVVNGNRFVTPLFLVLILIETTDLIFAVDSIPAILAITTNQFIVYTSNVFAILGLRSLYFSLSGLFRIFRFLHYGLSAILIFVGIKMLIAEFYEIPTVSALLVILGILIISILSSVLIKPGSKV